MPLITNSRLAVYRRCPREHAYRYGERVAPAAAAPALRFGSLVHAGLEAWWLATRAPAGQGRAPSCATLRSEAAAIALKEASKRLGCDDYELARAVALLGGYETLYGGDGWRALAVECEFRAHIPGEPSSVLEGPWSTARGPAFGGWRIAGKLDVVAERQGRVAVIEHKTSSMPLDPGGPYWQRLRQDGQISLYLEGARALGYDATCVVYDVLGTADLDPLLATPAEKQKRRLDGALYARQRAEDESLHDYQMRLIRTITADATRYYARSEVVRLEDEAEEHRRELREWCKRLVGESAAPKNPDACYRYGRLCEYSLVCAGTESLDSHRYVRMRWPHPELKEDL